MEKGWKMFLEDVEGWWRLVFLIWVFGKIGSLFLFRFVLFGFDGFLFLILI